MTNVTKFVLTSLISTFSLISLMCIIVLLSMASTVYAGEGSASDAVYVNGGIGQEDADEMRAKAGNFNLRLYMSTGKYGQSITGTQVTITDKKGNVVLDEPSGGPMLFVHVVNGSYTINAIYNGTTITRKAVVTNRRSANVYLTWKASDTDLDTED